MVQIEILNSQGKPVDADSIKVNGNAIQKNAEGEFYLERSSDHTYTIEIIAPGYLKFTEKVLSKERYIACFVQRPDELYYYKAGRKTPYIPRKDMLFGALNIPPYDDINPELVQEIKQLLDSLNFVMTLYPNYVGLKNTGSLDSSLEGLAHTFILKRKDNGLISDDYLNELVVLRKSNLVAIIGPIICNNEELIAPLCYDNRISVELKNEFATDSTSASNLIISDLNSKNIKYEKIEPIDNKRFTIFLESSVCEEAVDIVERLLETQHYYLIANVTNNYTGID